MIKNPRGRHLKKAEIKDGALIKAHYIICAIILLIMSSGCASRQDGQHGQAKQDNAKVLVSASFYPLARFAQIVGGDNIEVFTITPPGASPHFYEPTPRDIQKAYTSDIFIYNGLMLDPGAEKIAEGAEKNGVLVQKMSDKVIPKGEEKNNPHIWLTPKNAIKIVEEIRNLLIQADPQNEPIYKQNTEKYLQQLSMLDEKIKQKLSNCKNNKIITAHNSFLYFCNEYNLEIIPIAGNSPDQEPSPKKMSKIVSLAEKENIKYVFSEKSVSSKISETIAAELKAEILELDPAASLSREQLSNGETYISIMEGNLEKLRTALECN